MDINSKTKEYIKETMKKFLNNIDISFMTYQGHVPLNDEEFLSDCFIHQLETGKDILSEYLSIYSATYKYEDYDKFIFNLYLHNVTDDEWKKLKEKYISEIDEVLNMESYWKISDKSISNLNSTKNKLINSKNPFSTAPQKEAAKNNLIKNYYSYIDISYQDDLQKIKEYFTQCKKVYIDVLPVSIPDYPVLISIFDKNNNVLRICKCGSNIEGKIKSLSREYEGCYYSYLSIDEKISDAIFSELCVYFNPRDLYGVAFSSNQSPYKSINTIKARYKGELNINLSTIKKVCKMYNIDIHYLNNDVCVVNKSEVDRAMTQYTGRDFINPPNQK